MDFLGLRDIRERLALIEDASPPARDDTVTADKLIEMETSLASIVAHVTEIDEMQGQIIETLGDLTDGAKQLTLAVAEGIEKTNRAERRIRASVSRARKELRELGLEDPGLEAEAGDLHEVDGEGSEEGGLHPVPATVAEDASTPSSIKGVSVELIRRVRGI